MHKYYTESADLQKFPWLPATSIDIRNAGGWIQSHFARQLGGAKALVQMLPPGAQEAVELMAECGLAECFERMLEPPVTLCHGDYRPENLRFSAPGQPSAVATFDWGLVN